jgi:hypothetical protein
MHGADPLAEPAGTPPGVRTKDGDRPAVGLDKPRENSEESRLPRPVSTEHSVDLARRHTQGHAAQRFVLPNDGWISRESIARLARAAACPSASRACTAAVTGDIVHYGVWAAAVTSERGQKLRKLMQGAAVASYIP